MQATRDIAFGRAFFRQSLANRDEAEILMNERRFAAALASCQHAVEKAIKAVLYVELGAGNFQLRHDMSAELGLSSRLVLTTREFSRLQELENLLPPSPRRPIRRNTEYPWAYPHRPTRVYYPHVQFRSRRNTERFLKLCTRIQERVRLSFPELR